MRAGVAGQRIGFINQTIRGTMKTANNATGAISRVFVPHPPALPWLPIVEPTMMSATTKAPQKNRGTITA